jgi:hypothetical protein
MGSSDVEKCVEFRVADRVAYEVRQAVTRRRRGTAYLTEADPSLADVAQVAALLAERSMIMREL